MERELHILMLEDNPTDAELVTYTLRQGGLSFVSKRVETEEDFFKELTDFQPDVILLDYELPTFDGSSALIISKNTAPDTPVIFVTGVLGEESAIDMLHRGATDYVLKDNLSRLVPAVERALSEVDETIKRRGAEEAFRESEEVLRKTQFTVDHSSDSVFWVSSEGKIVYANQEACWRRGYTREEMLSLEIFDINESMAADPGLWERLRERIQQEGHFTVEFRHRTKNGEVFPVEAVLDFFELEGGWLFVANVRDITDRKASEEALRQSEHQLSLIFENVAEVLFLLSVEPDDRYRFLAVNDAFLEATGLLEDQVVGKYVNEVIPEPSLTLVLAKYKQAIQDNTTARWEEVTDYPAGRKYGEVAVTPIVDSSGCCTNLQGSVHDVTEPKAAEEALKLANMELEGYAHTVSHDLRGSLSASGAAIDLIKDMRQEPLTDDVLARLDEGLDIVASGVGKAITLTEDLLTLAKAEQAPATAEPVEISGVVRAVLEERKMLLKERGVEVNVDDDLGVAAMDPTHAYQVFSNLIDNAIKHNDSENPEIHVSRQGESGPGELRYLVRDNGPGIPVGAEEDIFLPFYKGENSTDTGIGLSIVDKVLRLYGGQIRAYYDGGACFEFTLPRFSS